MFFIPKHIHKITELQFTSAKNKETNQPRTYQPFSFEFKSISNLVLHDISGLLFSGQFVAVIGKNVLIIPMSFNFFGK